MMEQTEFLSENYYNYANLAITQDKSFFYKTDINQRHHLKFTQKIPLVDDLCICSARD